MLLLCRGLQQINSSEASYGRLPSSLSCHGPQHFQLPGKELAHVIAFQHGLSGLFAHPVQMAAIFQGFHYSLGDGCGRTHIREEGVVPIAGHFAYWFGVGGHHQTAAGQGLHERPGKDKWARQVDVRRGGPQQCPVMPVRQGAYEMDALRIGLQALDEDLLPGFARFGRRTIMATVIAPMTTWHSGRFLTTSTAASRNCGNPR